jgi:hypothetical protein
MAASELHITVNMTEHDCESLGMSVASVNSLGRFGARTT